MREATHFESLIKREKLIVTAALAGLTALAWIYILTGAGTGMSTIAMTTLQFPPPIPGMHMSRAWSGGYWVIMFFMWWIMMIAMMLPSAAPMILLHARVTRHGQRRGQIAAGAVPSAVFTGGYLSVWAGFSLAATLLQWLLELNGLVHGMMMWSTARGLTAGLLIAAGLYQLTPWKMACLEHCRSPAEYLSRHWRPGAGGAFRMGLVHGAYCLGCCWVLMLLLFAGGIMNLVWIAGLALLVLGEKVLPGGRIFARASAFAMIAAGVGIGLR